MHLSHPSSWIRSIAWLATPAVLVVWAGCAREHAPNGFDPDAGGGGGGNNDRGPDPFVHGSASAPQGPVQISSD